MLNSVATQASKPQWAGLPAKFEVEIPACQRTLQSIQSVPAMIPIMRFRPPIPIRWQRILADVTGGAVGNMGFTVDDFREYINSLKQRRRVLSPPRCHSARVGTTSLTSDQPLSRSSKNCRILNIEESKIWLSPSSHRSTDERDTPSSRESRVLPQVDRLEKFRKRVKISAFSRSRRSFVRL
jgi:hypothetical protein